METHHPHHITHKKKWTEYLLKFFMLLLAVFPGLLQKKYKNHTVLRSLKIKNNIFDFQGVIILANTYKVTAEHYK